MVVNADLLDKARAAGAQLADAEHQALLTRAEYHTAIRRLHLAGGSLREIGEALSLSHQRVQQIVDAAGGSWWSRIWRTRHVKPDAVCTWCRRPPSEVNKLIAGPKVYICDVCVTAAERAMTAAPQTGDTLRRAKAGASHRCAFCSKRGTGTRAMALGPANVCSDCVRLCREILVPRDLGVRS
jgi:hypothetical protein